MRPRNRQSKKIFRYDLPSSNPNPPLLAGEGALLKEIGEMITEIGAVLSLEEVEILVNFIGKSLDRAKIVEMQKSGMWEIYDNLRMKLREDD